MIKNRRPLRRIDNRTKIELLVAEGFTWAGWYCQVCLDAKFSRVFGSFMHQRAQ
jgi:hypothetical protein